MGKTKESKKSKKEEVVDEEMEVVEKKSKKEKKRKLVEAEGGEGELKKEKKKKKKKAESDEEEEEKVEKKEKKKKKKAKVEEDDEEEAPKKKEKKKKKKADSSDDESEEEKEEEKKEESEEEEETLVIKNKDTKAAAQVAACTSTKVFFGNLSFQIDDDAMKAAVEKCGKVVSIQWMTDRETGRFRGSGIIEFESTEAAGKAAMMEGEDICGRPCKCRVWEDRPKAGGDRPKRELSARPDNCTTVFCGNLSYEIDDDKMSEFFKKAGDVKQIRWLTNRETGEFRGCGFVEFYDSTTVDEAIKLNGENLLGRSIRLDYSAPRAPRQ